MRTCCSTVRPAGILSDKIGQDTTVQTKGKHTTIPTKTVAARGKKKHLRGSVCWMGGAREAGLGLVVGRTGSIAKPGKAFTCSGVNFNIGLVWFGLVCSEVNIKTLVCGDSDYR